MLTHLKSLCYHTGYFAYNSGYSALKLATSGAYLIKTADDVLSGAAYTVKGLVSTAYYGAKDIPPLVSAYYSACDDASRATAQAALQTTRTDFSRVSTTYLNEMNSISLYTDAKATCVNGARSVGLAVTAAGHALEAGHDVLKIGSEILETTGNVLKFAGDRILGENSRFFKPVRSNPKEDLILAQTLSATVSI
ncbi:MAG TPA: hypothetical protein VHM20_05010 [Gammaproteobacteria bacterium]|jgi:hypothetical protein|nr:hypothetical protein [Gammaproteobacteria bacterium]